MCTNFIVGSAKPGFVVGRSMEFAADLKSRLYFRAAGHEFEPIALTDYGFGWTGKYNVVAINSFGLPVISDGMNDQGLCTGNLWLPGSVYQTISDKAKGIPVDRFPMWLLSSFATVAEVRNAMANRVVEVGLPQFPENLLPLHFPVHDATGDSIVIEFTDGQAIVYENEIGTLTNQPEFPWHLNNLRNYINLTPWDSDKENFRGLEIKATGHGTGLKGLPGDPTPPSRFVKAALSSVFAEPFETMDEGVTLTLHILNSVDIPKGMNKYRNEVTQETEGDYTQWVVAKDLERKIYFVRTYDSPQVYAVTLSDVDWAALDGKQVDIPVSPISLDLDAAVSGGLAGSAETVRAAKTLEGAV